jgi:predicted small lipoprotein YifL
MHSILSPEKSCGIILILSLLLEGCGHKGPLKLPEPQIQQPQAQATSPQITDTQNPGLPPLQQDNQP